MGRWGYVLFCGFAKQVESRPSTSGAATRQQEKKVASEASARAAIQKESQKRNSQPGGVEIPAATSK
eukprot:3907018-Pyramimonas_sp.AAC.1